MTKLEFDQADGFTLTDEGETNPPYHQMQVNLLVPKVNFGASLPATCTASNGEVFFLTTATAGENLYLCTATNTWTVAYGIAASWEALTNAADTATSYISDNNAETFSLDFQSAFATDRFRLVQSTGNPTAGTLFTLAAADPDVVMMEIEIAAAQTADALQLTSNGGTAGDLFSISAAGVLRGPTGTETLQFDPDNDGVAEFEIDAVGSQPALSSPNGGFIRIEDSFVPASGFTTLDLGLSANPWQGIYGQTLELQGTAASTLLIQPSSEPSGIVNLVELYDTTGTTPYFRLADTGEIHVNIDGTESTTMLTLAATTVSSGADKWKFDANAMTCTTAGSLCRVNLWAGDFYLESSASQTRLREIGTNDPIIMAPNDVDFASFVNDGTSASMDLEATSGQTADLFTVTTNGGSAGDLFAIEASGRISFGGDGDSYLEQSADDLIDVNAATTAGEVRVFINGGEQWHFSNNRLESQTAGGPRINTAASSCSSPSYVLQSDSDSGVGITAGSQVCLTADSNVILTANEDGTNATTTIEALGGQALANLHIDPIATAPSTCSIGDVYVDTSGAFCACTATDTWSNTTGTGSCA